MESMCQYLLTTSIGLAVLVCARVVAVCRRFARRVVNPQASPLTAVYERRPSGR